MRFPDFDSISIVKAQLANCLKDDIHYIASTPVKSMKEEKEKENLLLKIKAFITRQYPDILLDEIEFDIKFSSGEKAKNL